MSHKIKANDVVLELQVHDLKAAIAFYGEAFVEMARECGGAAARAELEGTTLVLSQIGTGPDSA